MGIASSSASTALALHLRRLREQHNLTLAMLADRSGLSRATLSRIENAEVSPTAETLGQLASVYALPISQLLAPMEQTFQPVIRRADQAVWHDVNHDFHRRSISPPNGALSIEMIECTLGPEQNITYTAPAIPGHEHHLYVLSGRLEMTVENQTHILGEGDCLRYVLFGPTVFRTTATPCRYVIVLS
nr:XRE family transcriptional regulator [Falsirhodobacter sp. alg1]